MRPVMLLVWTAAFAVLWMRAPAPLVTVLVLQAAVCVSFLLLVAGRSAVAADLERRAVALADAIWRAADRRVIDTTIDGIGATVRGWSTALRRAQAGSVRVHAVAALAAVLIMIGFLLWR